jgi:hypothetical protein
MPTYEILRIAPQILENSYISVAEHRIGLGSVVRQDADFSEIAETSTRIFRRRRFSGQRVLKRCVLIFSDLIFESRVDRGMPSLASKPKVRHARASVIVSFRSFSNQTAAKSMTTERAWTPIDIAGD